MKKQLLQKSDEIEDFVGSRVSNEEKCYYLFGPGSVGLCWLALGEPSIGLFWRSSKDSFLESLLHPHSFYYLISSGW